MQVDKAITRHCPFLLESDFVSLSPDFSFDVLGNFLQDRTVGTEHHFEPPARCILQALIMGTKMTDLRWVAAKHHLQEIQLTELLGFLNLVGGLERRRSLKAWPLACLVQLKHLLMAVRYSAASWRRPANAWSISLGVLRASSAVIVATCLFGLLITGSGLAPIVLGLAATGYGLGIFLLSLFVHEWVHVLIIRRQDVRAAVLQRGMRLGILHPTLKPSAEMFSALAGPLTGLAVGLAAATIMYERSATLTFISVLASIFHLGGLLPWYGDGISLRRALTSKESSYETRT